MEVPLVEGGEEPVGVEDAAVSVDGNGHGDAPDLYLFHSALGVFAGAQQGHLITLGPEDNNNNVRWFKTIQKLDVNI